MKITEFCEFSTFKTSCRHKKLRSGVCTIGCNQFQHGFQRLVENLFASIWCASFINMHEKAGSFIPSGPAEQIAEITEQLANFETRKVCNVDESGLYDRMGPSRS